MPKLALLFPGQGVQAVGMLEQLSLHFPPTAELLAIADQALGWSLSQLVNAGPVERLNHTPYTQPAILVASLAYYQAWQVAGVQADAAIGLSLGEYSALAAAGAIDLPTAVQLVHQRGQAMDAAYPADAGKVVVVLGLDRETVVTICAEQSQENSLVQASNFNAPDQVVIAGDQAAVERAMAALTAAGAKRLLPLPVSAPFHTRLLRPAGELFAPHLLAADWRLPQFSVVSNVSAKVYQSVDEIKQLLVRQVSEPIEFAAGVSHLLELGFTHFLEVGPGSTVGGMVKKISRQATIYKADTPAQIAAVAATIQSEMGGLKDE